MQNKRFTIKIKAPAEKIWKVLWNGETYPQWTAAFGEGSHAVTDWQEGSKVLFLSANNDGMYSMVVKNKPGVFMSFRHLGIIKEGKEQPADEESKKWSGAMENYTLKEEAGGTDLIVEMDITEEFEKYFQETFPKALEKVKELSENKSEELKSS